MEISKLLVHQNISDRIKQLGRHFKQELDHCILCHNKNTELSSLCQYCLNDLPTINSPYANLLMLPNIANNISHQYIHSLYCLAPHQWPFSKWITQIKYHQAFSYAQLLAELLSNHLGKQLNEESRQNILLVAVPLHIQKWQNRGYNQAHLLAKYIANNLNIKYLDKLLIRTKNTDSQVGQSGAERRKNLKRAFTVNPKYISTIKDKDLLIIDDVVTTGSTINEIAKELNRYQINSLSAASLTIALK